MPTEIAGSQNKLCVGIGPRQANGGTNPVGAYG
jgi:hypothetical protein